MVKIIKIIAFVIICLFAEVGQLGIVYVWAFSRGYDRGYDRGIEAVFNWLKQKPKKDERYFSPDTAISFNADSSGWVHRDNNFVIY